MLRTVPTLFCLFVFLSLLFRFSLEHGWFGNVTKVVRAAKNEVLQEQNNRQRLKAANIVAESRIVREVKAVYERRCYRSGIFRRRCVIVARQIIVGRTVTSLRSNLDDGIGWDSIGDPRLGFYEDSYSVKMLPAAAGARATKINSAADVLLKDGASVVFGLDDFDRSMIRTPKMLTPDGRITPNRKLIRVEAKVAGLRDDNVRIGVKIQQRDAAGNLVVDAVMLNAEAKTIWTNLEKQLAK